MSEPNELIADLRAVLQQFDDGEIALGITSLRLLIQRAEQKQEEDDNQLEN